MEMERMSKSPTPEEVRKAGEENMGIKQEIMSSKRAENIKELDPEDLELFKAISPTLKSKLHGEYTFEYKGHKVEVEREYELTVGDNYGKHVLKIRVDDGPIVKSAKAEKFYSKIASFSRLKGTDESIPQKADKEVRMNPTLNKQRIEEEISVTEKVLNSLLES